MSTLHNGIQKLTRVTNMIALTLNMELWVGQDMALQWIARDKAHREIKTRYFKLQQIAEVQSAPVHRPTKECDTSPWHPDQSLISSVAMDPSLKLCRAVAAEACTDPLLHWCHTGYT